MELIRKLLRGPAAAAVLSLIAVVAFYVIVGRANLLELGAAASWLNFAANLGIIALPVGLLMIAGEIDISFGAMIPAGAITIALLSGTYGLPIEVGILGSLGLGAIVGLINGLLTTRTKVPSLLITLGTLTIMQGVVLWGAMSLAGNASIPLKSPDWAKFLFGHLIGNSHQVVIVWWVVMALAFGFFLHKTRYGNWIFALGGDRNSARNAGVPTTKMTIALFIMSAMAACFVGMCGAIQFNTTQVSGGMSYIFNVIASVVVGGVLLTGGFGSVTGIFIGTLTFAIVNKGISFTAINPNWANLIIGTTLVLAMLMNEYFRKKALAYSPKKV
ncbi:MAG: ABC transporter permease [Aestuariivirga sp.]|uniref:ABC transporter permease n=1 Tax=Aestuariivirga sp. TaxID=2650926 RepID=UPI00301774CB